MKTAIVGKIYNSNRYGEFVVLEFLYKKNTAYYYNIKFLNTGTIMKADNSAIIKGNVRDSYARTIYGVACMGNIKAKHGSFEGVAWKRWNAMLARCYSENSIEYPYYGKRGVTVCDRWLIFKNYVEDIQQIEGFNMDEYMKGDIQLDKDTKYGSKEYSKEACVFLPKRENILYQVSKMKPFIAISPKGDIKRYNLQSVCAKENGLTARTIGKVLNGKLKSHKGWKFVYEV